MSGLINGYTLIHEHITIDLSTAKNDLDCKLDSIEESISELKQLYEIGVRNIVDVTNIGMGRNLSYVKEVEKQTGIRIIMSTGFYKEPFLPQFVYEHTENELADFMIKELTEGIEDTRIKAELIAEIGSSKNKMKPMEKKVFDAAIIAAKETKCPISTHTTLGTYALEQANYLIQNGILPKQIVIGHMDLSGNLDIIKTVLKTGVFVGFDTIGKVNYQSDERRIEHLFNLNKLGLLDQVMLSMDLTRKSQLKSFGGMGYEHLFTDFLPKLNKVGFDGLSINQMLIVNPKKFFMKNNVSMIM